MKHAFATAVFAAGTLLAGSAMAYPQMPPQTNGDSAQESMAAPPHRVGDMYTTALNTLYAHGFHGVQHLSLMNGEVQAMAITPSGTPRTVMVNPATRQISAG